MLATQKVYNLSHITPFLIWILMTSAFSVHRCLFVYEEFVLDVLDLCDSFCVLHG